MSTKQPAMESWHHEVKLSLWLISVVSNTTEGNTQQSQGQLSWIIKQSQSTYQMPWSSSHQRETAAAQEPVIVLSLIAHGTTSSCWRHNYLAARMAVLILTVGNISNYSLSVSTEPLEINGCYLRQSQHTTTGNEHSSLLPTIIIYLTCIPICGWESFLHLVLCPTLMCGRPNYSPESCTPQILL